MKLQTGVYIKLPKLYMVTNSIEIYEVLVFLSSTFQFIRLIVNCI